jgi:dihydrofolate synthase/folylpolyglutamate synthase
MLASILRAAGYRTGLYTSPHLLSFTERIRVDGTSIGEAEVVELTAVLSAACAGRFAEEPAPPPEGALPHPTFFELTTAMAFLHFLRQGVEIAVIEVGLGGRLDATNAIRPRAVLLTNVGFDHREYLGGTLGEIAAEKAGIIKPGVPVLTGAEGEALELFRRVAAERGAPLLSVAETHGWRLRDSGAGGTGFDLSGPAGRYEALRIPLAGRHQLLNAVLAVAGAETLAGQGFPCGEPAVRAGLAAVRWPGRLQVVPGSPRLFLDGAHNPPGAATLGEFLAEQRPRLGRLVLVFGVLKDKEWRAMLPHLFPLADAVVLTKPPSERAEEPAAIRSAYPGMENLRVEADVARAIALARVMAGPEGTVVVTGSLYTVATAIRALGLPVA